MKVTRGSDSLTMPSLTEMFGVPLAMSLSKMVPTPAARAMVALTALNRFSASTSVGSTPAVLSTGIFTTLVVSPGAKVSVLACAA